MHHCYQLIVEHLPLKLPSQWVRLTGFFNEWFPKLILDPLLIRKWLRFLPHAPDLILRLKLANACAINDSIFPFWRMETLGNGSRREQGYYCRKLKKSDGALDFSQPAEELSSRIRAFQTWPGCFFNIWETESKSGNLSHIWRKL